MPYPHSPMAVPADVPQKAEQEYLNNYAAITRNTGRLMLFSCDQKVEHLNSDFYGPSIAPEVNNPEHLFTIAQQGRIGAMATHVGLIARYGKMYDGIKFIAKLNGKTNVASSAHDPFSKQLWSVAQVVEFKEQAHLAICGVGITIYLGSSYEPALLEQAAQTVYLAHQAGLITIVWIYIRAKDIKDDRAAELIAGAAGVAASLGADFVKVKPPHGTRKLSDIEALRIATSAAGNTKLICAGGESMEPKLFLQQLHDQITLAGTAGNATGRNIFQRPVTQAVAMTNAIAAIVFDNATVETSYTIYEKESRVN